VASVHPSVREIAVKIVYYGPGLAGKTTALSHVHRTLRPDARGQLVSLATGVDRTLYFDFLPVRQVRVRGYTLRVQLYTVPGQVHYNSTRKLVLTGADGVVFVADSQRPRMAANVESLENLGANLAEQGLALPGLPLVLMLNKRDTPDAMPTAELEARLGGGGIPCFESVATRGLGVFDTLKSITSLVLGVLRAKLPDEGTAREESGPFTEVAAALSALGGEGKSSGPHRVPATPARDLSDLLQPGRDRDAVCAIEAELERGTAAGAVRLAASTYRDLAARIAGAMAHAPDEAPALSALLCGVPANRYLRFRELVGRADENGAVTSADALFALFFVTDLALRADELRRG
jgi:signal recognition particle receptor subunit beta